MSEEKPYDGKRFTMKGLGGTSQYIIIDTDGIMITFPNNKHKNWNYQATATALTRVISIALQGGIDIEGIKKQLKESVMQDNDTPHILLKAIKKYENSGE